MKLSATKVSGGEGTNGGRCARQSCACAMRDRTSNAVRAQWYRGAPTAVARWPGGPDSAAPG
eukprot:2641943-Prymnesium_polylepis.1